MKKISLILFIIISIFFFNNCNKTKTQKKSELKNIIASDKNTEVSVKTEKRIKKFPPSELSLDRVIIKSFELSPDNPTMKDDIEAKIEVETQDVEGINFYYIFYRNKKVVKEGENNILSPGLFKKNDIIFCDAVILKDGKEIKRVRSNYIKVLDLPPEIVEIKYPNSLNKPNPYKIYVKADDPDDEELNFSLDINDPKVNAKIEKISPKEAEILIVLSKEDFNKKITLNIKVEDSEGSYVNQELSFKLSTKVFKKEIKKGAVKQKTSKKKKKVNKGEGIPIRKIG